ncbi:cytochrome P450 [Truncatella angustata]|uniref:Cytochrome P450 n=1 Tax=Truncatella angustata TaxID=152316 RepID=A0A9P8UWB4_9PEZI|nr:cytochrome P450 [Truncatella angustata]KAH6660474.1 cytochrome P450 [Truncatella angustata]
MSSNATAVSPLAQLPFVASFFIICAVSLLYLTYQWVLPKPIPGIPYNKEAVKSILGDAAEIKKLKEQGGRPRAWFGQQPWRHNSPLVQVFLMPMSKPMLILSDYRESQDILLRRGKEFDRGGRGMMAMRGVLGNHHISMQTSDPQFKPNRELVKDLMTPHFLHTVSAPEIYRNTLKFVDLWKLKAEKASGRPFRADQDVHVVTFDIIKIVALGEGDSQSMTELYHDIVRESDFDSQRLDSKDIVFTFPEHLPDEDLHAHQVQQEAVASSVTFPSPALFHKFNNRKAVMKEVYASKDRMFEKQIDLAVKRLEAGEEVKSALDYMVKRETNAAKKAGRPAVFNSPFMKDELYGYIGAGHETTATSFQWALKHLAVHGDIQQKTRQALRTAYVDATAEGRQPTVTEITKIQVPYLEAVMEETLRLTGPVLGVSRQAQVDTVILGHRIPKGTEVFMPTMGASIAQPSFHIEESRRSEGSQAHKDTRSSWDDQDPQAFIPERWLKTEDGSESFDHQAGPLLSFSLGVRGCFGRRLAYLEFRILMALLIWNLELGSLPQELNTFDAIDSLTTKPAKCYVRISHAKN